ncbi:hypothetical protein OIO11_02680 [Clostridium sp. ZS2-4]|nr:hypothetical protein [Clostridium sp. ZS2-4]MCY6354134.1 hypothetical protein [Clostridium sp. ZS2-4]
MFVLKTRTAIEEIINETIGNITFQDEILTSYTPKKHLSYKILRIKVTIGATKIFLTNIDTNIPHPITINGTITNCMRKGSIDLLINSINDMVNPSFHYS